MYILNVVILICHFNSIFRSMYMYSTPAFKPYIVCYVYAYLAATSVSLITFGYFTLNPTVTCIVNSTSIQPLPVRGGSYGCGHVMTEHVCVHLGIIGLYGICYNLMDNIKGRSIPF